MSAVQHWLFIPVAMLNRVNIAAAHAYIFTVMMIRLRNPLKGLACVVHAWTIIHGIYDHGLCGSISPSFDLRIIF